MRITASLLVCCAAAGVAVGALTLDPIRRPPASPPAPIAAAAPATAAPSTHPARRGASTTTPTATITAVTMTIKGFRFADVQASPGQTVQVVNADGADHTVTAKDGGFDVTVPAGGTASFVAPTTPGRYAFVCQIHSNMTATLVVA